MSNRRNGTLHIGVTSDLARRIWEHRERTGSSLYRKHDVVHLVHAERHERIEAAIAREKAIKG